jgi:hypothetical protein
MKPLNNIELHKNFILIHEFLYPGEPIKGWVRKDETYTGSFHNNWECLMDIVERIEGLVFENDNFPNVTIGGSNYCIIQDSNSELFEFIGESETKILSAYSAIVKFIEWYNKNLNK